MGENKTAMQKIEEKTRKKFEKTRENIKNVLDKMRNDKLFVREADSSQKEQE